MKDHEEFRKLGTGRKKLIRKCLGHQEGGGKKRWGNRRDLEIEGP